MPKGGPPRYEWSHGGHVDMRNVDGPWTCDCPSYGLKPKPNAIGMCVTCFRPVYDDDGHRVKGEHIHVR